IRVETPLGADVLVADSATITEQMNGNFEIRLTAHCKQKLSPSDLIGKLVDVSIKRSDDPSSRRTWNCFVKSMVEGPLIARGTRCYTITGVPEIKKLQMRSDNRIWQNVSSIEVVQTLFKEHGITPPVIKVISLPQPRTFSQQRNETDYNYAIRLLEEDGISRYFVHSGGVKGSVAAKHEMYLCKETLGYQTSAHPKVRFAHGTADVDHITRFDSHYTYVSGSFAATDWNFKTPNGAPMGSTPSLVNLQGNQKLQLYQETIIGGYGSGGASEQINSKTVEAATRLRMQAIEADHQRVRGESNVRTLAPGFRFTPFDVANPAEVFEEHVIYSITHVAHGRSFEAGSSDAEHYSNSFEALPSRVPATPHMTIAPPRVYSAGTMIIAGPQGEEIYTDEFGRVFGYCASESGGDKFGVTSMPLSYPNLEASLAQSPKMRAEFLLPILSGIFSLIIFLCTHAAEINGGRHPGNPVAKKTRRGVKMFAPDRPTVWDVGTRLGAALRAAYAQADAGDGGETGRGVRPHIRRAHWHTFLSGPVDRDRRREVRWLPPIPVKVEDYDGLAVVIRRVGA
ncbi:MAG: type VI secretion system tip protein VgrG, partial [Alphaproteobacteria bacterium]|nr:type VI secretion system tip protein VgrG [Alphaproteobacteria bacterium]